MHVKPEKFQIFIINANSETGFMKAPFNELQAKFMHRKVTTNSIFQDNAL